eukprot:175904-Rhodomonas_salina.3
MMRLSAKFSDLMPTFDIDLVWHARMAPKPPAMHLDVTSESGHCSRRESSSRFQMIFLCSVLHGATPFRASSETLRRDECPS